MKNFSIIFFALFVYYQASAIPNLKFHDEDTPILSNKLILDEIDIIGIGEATHGDHQSQIFRISIIKEVMSGSFNVLAIEHPPHEVKYINNLCQSVHWNNNDSLLRAIYQLQTWPWKTIEFINIVRIIGQINSLSENKIKIVGVDNDYTGEARDEQMSKELLFFVEKGSKVIFLAHNVHVAHFQPKTSKTFLNNHVGDYLKKELKNRYYSIGIISDEGEIIAKNAKTNNLQRFTLNNTNKLNQFISIYGRDIEASIFIDLRDPVNIKKYKLNNQMTRSWFIGARYFDRERRNNIFLKKYIIQNSFDGIIYCKELSPSTNLEVANGISHFDLEQELRTKFIGDTLIFNFSAEFMTNDDTESFATFYINYKVKNKWVRKNMYTDSLCEVNNKSSQEIKVYIPCRTDKVKFGFYLEGKGYLSIRNLSVNMNNHLEAENPSLIIDFEQREWLNYVFKIEERSKAIEIRSK